MDDVAEFQNCCIFSNSPRHASLKPCNRSIVPPMAISRNSTKLLSGSKRAGVAWARQLAGELQLLMFNGLTRVNFKIA